MAVLVQEFRSLAGAGEPFGILLHLVVQHGEHPHLPALQPDELIGIEHAAVAVQAGEIPAIFGILRLFQPERKHLPVQFVAIALRRRGKIHFLHIFSWFELQKYKQFSLDLQINYNTVHHSSWTIDVPS